MPRKSWGQTYYHELLKVNANVEKLRGLIAMNSGEIDKLKQRVGWLENRVIVQKWGWTNTTNSVEAKKKK